MGGPCAVLDRDLSMRVVSSVDAFMPLVAHIMSIGLFAIVFLYVSE